MKFTHTEVMNFNGAFRGLRNPLESWEKSDSYFGIINLEYDDYVVDEIMESWVRQELDKTELPPNAEPIEEYSKEWEDLKEKYWDWWYETGVLLRDDDYMEIACLGPNDLSLAQRMIRAGSSDRKFLRQIMVSVDITAPLYWQNSFCQ